MKRFSTKNQRENTQGEFREGNFQATPVQSDKSYQNDDSKKVDKNISSHHDGQGAVEIEKNSKDIAGESSQNKEKLSQLSYNKKTKIIKQKQGHNDNDSPKSTKKKETEYSKVQEKWENFK